jgi:Domain of unknown function (DUF4331)
MMKCTSWMSALAALGVLSISGVAAASSHREAPGIADDPAADNTDTYAWVQGSNLVVVANYIGLELPEGGPNWAKFSDDVLYQIHIARGGTSLADALTYQIRFTTAPPVRANQAATTPLTYPNTRGIEFFAQLTGTGSGAGLSGAFNQTYTVTQLTNGGTPTVVATNVPVPPPNVGPETNAVTYGFGATDTYESFWINSGKSTGTLTGGGSIFAGPRDDPFFVDLGAIFDLAQLRPVANPTSTLKVRDSIAYMNAHAIVLQIPLAVANGAAIVAGAGNAAQTVGVWASASRRKVRLTRRSVTGDVHFGPWVQVSRLGLPLINEAVIGLQDKDYWNRLTPADDLTVFGAYILNPIVVRDAQAIGFYGASGPLTATGCDTSGGTDVLTGRTDIVGVINLGNANITSIGDVLRVDLGAATSGFPNGRLLTDTVVDTELGLLLCGASRLGKIAGAAGPQANEPEAPLPKGGATPVFPYLQTPWEGRFATPRTANTP